MKTIRIIVLFCFLFVSLCPVSFAAKKTKKRKAAYSVSANSALLFDTSGWRKYYSKDIHQKVFPASTTKVMAAIIVLEKMRLDDIVTVSGKANDVLPSKIEIVPGEKYKVRDLLYAALLNSANDASVALAEAAAGSEHKFVEMMNRKARDLGAKNTVFANAHGLPSKAPQYSTAYDMYLIFREALKKQFFREAIKIKYMTIHSQAGRKIALRSHNKALFKNWKQNVYGKTGYTRAAQACFVGTVAKGKEILIIVVFGCSKRWDDIKHIIEKYGGVNL